MRGWEKLGNDIYTTYTCEPICVYQYHRPPAPQAPGMQAPSTTHIRAGHGMRHMSQVVPGAFYSCVPDSAIGTSLTPMYSNNVMYAPVLVMHCIVCPSTHHSGRAVRRRVLNLQMAAPAAAPIINAITNNFIVWPSLRADLLGPGDDAETHWAKTLVVARLLDQVDFERRRRMCRCEVHRGVVSASNVYMKDAHGAIAQKFPC